MEEDNLSSNPWRSYKHKDKKKVWNINYAQGLEGNLCKCEDAHWVESYVINIFSLTALLLSERLH